MTRLDAGIPSLNKALARHQVFDTSTSKDLVAHSVINGSRVVDAKTGTGTLTKPASITYTNFKTSYPRDAKLYKTTDMWDNQALENSKEQREQELEARKQKMRRMPLEYKH